PGGVGKTALVIQTLKELSLSIESKWNAGIIYITLKEQILTPTGIKNLDAINSVGVIRRYIISCCNTIFDSDYDTFDELISDLSNRNIVLFLDNIETIVRAQPENILEFVLDLPPSWKVIVTSRISIDAALTITIEGLNEKTAEYLCRR